MVLWIISKILPTIKQLPSAALPHAISLSYCRRHIWVFLIYVSFFHFSFSFFFLFFRFSHLTTRTSFSHAEIGSLETTVTTDRTHTAPQSLCRHAVELPVQYRICRSTSLVLYSVYGNTCTWSILANTHSFATSQTPYKDQDPLITSPISPLACARRDVTWSIRPRWSPTRLRLVDADHVVLIILTFTI